LSLSISRPGTEFPSDDAFHDRVPLFSLADGAAGVRVRRAPAGGCDGADRAAGGPCAPTAAPVVPCPEAPRDFPRPPLQATDLHTDVIRVIAA
jgi:hypothetical protein